MASMEQITVCDRGENTSMTCNYNPGLLTDKEHLTRYHNIFTDIFLKNTNEVHVIFQWLRNDFQNAVVPKLVSAFGKDRQLKALGIGTGDGDRDQMMIRKLSEKFGRLSYTVVEPGDIIEKFKLSVSADPGLAQYVWHSVPFEKFCQETSGSHGKFDFISAIHSVYYLEDITSSLRCILEMLQDGGVIMFVINDDDSDMRRFLASLKWKRGNIRPRKRNVDIIEGFATSENLRTLKYRLSAKLDVTSCFDERSEEGAKLVDFLTNTAHHREKAPKAVWQQTLSALRSLARNNDTGGYFFRTDMHVILILKE